MCYRIIHHLHILCGNICSEMYTVSDDFGVKMPELDFTPHVNTALCPLIWTKIQESQDAQIRSADDRVDWLFVRPS